MKIIRSEYPCGPCRLPLKCRCGIILTEDNVVNEECLDECEVCDCCGTSKCPDCGEHVHCGGCGV